MAGFPKKPRGTHLGHSASKPRERALASWRDSAAAQHPTMRGKTRRADIPIPDADERWLPLARSWFNSLRLSGQSEFYEASDWATAVIAADTFDKFLRTYNASILAAFVRLSERLGVTAVDRKKARIELDEPGEVTDRDEIAADNVVHGWQQRLDARRKE
jgi:hypothetical protein